MLTAIFRRCLNPTGPACASATGGRNTYSLRCGARSYSIARQAVRTISTMYPSPPLPPPPPPPPPERGRK